MSLRETTEFYNRVNKFSDLRKPEVLAIAAEHGVEADHTRPRDEIAKDIVEAQMRAELTEKKAKKGKK